MLVLSDSSGNQVGLRFLDGAVLPVRHLKLQFFQRKVIPLLTAKLNHPLNKAYNSLSLPTKTNKHNSSRPKQVSKNHQSGKPETTNKVIRVKERERAREHKLVLNITQVRCPTKDETLSRSNYPSSDARN